ncbi:hypothetical protein R1A27_22240 [Methylobacterium sp. NMS12]|uniref:hypothetical protein n=1 Tax=Methylobacterium sp. NMS12 TaxID=3079766 RepID=UPI003F881831
MSELPATQPQRPRLPNVARHLEPERLVREHGPAVAAAFKAQFDRRSLQTASGLRDIELALREVPSIPELLGLAEALNQALDTKPSRSVNAMSVAVLVDSRVRPPANLATYVEALTFDLADLGYPPCVVVSALQRLRRESVFAPEIAEVLKACSDVQDSYRSTARIAGRLAADRRDAEDRLRIVEAAASASTVRPSPQQIDLNAEPGDAGW